MINKVNPFIFKLNKIYIFKIINKSSFKRCTNYVYYPNNKYYSLNFNKLYNVYINLLKNNKYAFNYKLFLIKKRIYNFLIWYMMYKNDKKHIYNYLIFFLKKHIYINKILNDYIFYLYNYLTKISINEYINYKYIYNNIKNNNIIRLIRILLINKYKKLINKTFNYNVFILNNIPYYKKEYIKYKIYNKYILYILYKIKKNIYKYKKLYIFFFIYNKCLYKIKTLYLKYWYKINKYLYLFVLYQYSIKKKNKNFLFLLNWK